MLEFMKIVAGETMSLILGLYGIICLVWIYIGISWVIERLVKWIGIQKSKVRTAKARRV